MIRASLHAPMTGATDRTTTRRAGGARALKVAVATVLAGSLGLAPLRALADSDSLGEIVVTARKRTENLQDVPLSINVFSEKALQELGITQFEDYATRTPSISFISAGPGTQTLVMRGVSDGSNPNYSNTSATGYLVDDMSMSYDGVFPDLHLYDLERIEVLNGPQGTTFGAGAMAGAVRFITNKPDPKAFSAGVDADTGKIDGGTGNLVTEGFVNIPLVADRTALRMSAYYDYHGGFINNLKETRHWVNGTVSNNAQWAGNNYNRQNTEGMRIALKQVFSEGWEASLTYLYQRQITHGAWDEDPARWGDRNVARFGPENKAFYTKAVDLHVDGDVGIADLVYAGTYWSVPSHNQNEYSEYMQYVHTATVSAGGRQAFTCKTDPYSSLGALNYTGCNVPTLYYDYIVNSERWSHELRLQSKPGKPLHWLAGLYWQKTKSPYNNYFHMPGLRTDGAQWQSYVQYNGTTTKPPAPDDWYSYDARSDDLQTTEFVNLSYDIGTQWTIELGTVHFQSHFSNSIYGGNWYAPQSPSAASGGDSKWNSKAGVSYRPANNILFYANVAQGFRDGGVNNGLVTSCTQKGAPAKYDPDSITSYELGWKTSFAENRITWNGAAYYMPWKNLQSSLYDPDICLPSSFNANIGDALIYGAESNVDWKVNDHLLLQAAANYNDSHLVSNSFQNPNFQVAPGERLPYVPYVSYSWTARYESPLASGFKGYGQIDGSHKGDMWNDLHASGSNGLPRVLQPQYSVGNLRLGLQPEDGRWLTELYVTNITNKNAIVYTNTGNFDLRQTMNEPRVLGLRLSYKFAGRDGAAR